MKRIFTVAILLMATFSILNAKEVKGRVYHNKKGLPDVVVSDGVKFTTTDKEGNFTINTHKDATHVFIVTPSGYMASCDSGSPHFYRSIDEENFNFELFKWGIPGGPYTLFAVADPQPRGEAAFNRLKNEGFADLKSHGEENISNSKPVISIFLGDILWDNLEMYPWMKEHMKEIGHPVWPVIGNHDHDLKISDDKGSAHIYEKFFGPANYAFNAGTDYFIVLDNILYKGNKKYDEGVSDEQIKWVKNYLKYVPQGSHIYLAMHAPITFYRGSYTTVNSEKLMDAFNGYTVTVISGHTHLQYNGQPRENIREYNITSIGGAWWLWDNKYGQDGTPLGYQVFYNNGEKTINYFKTLESDQGYQIKSFKPGTVEGYPNEVVIKIWNWDSRWKLKVLESVWSETGNGNTKSTYNTLPYKQVSMTDPDYAGYLQKEYIFNKEKEGKGSKPINDAYFFFVVRPSENAASLQIHATDPFGEIYSTYTLVR